MASREITIFRAHLQDALALARKGEGELAGLYKQVAADVTAQVRAKKGTPTALELERDIEQAFQKVSFKRAKIIKASIEGGGKLGPKASKKTMRAAYGEEVARAQVRASRKATNEAAERIAGRTAVDGVAVTKRLRKVDKQVASEMAREVEKGIRQKKGILGAARQIEKLDPREVKLPKYLQKVEAAARAGNVDALKQLTDRYTRYAGGLGEVQADLTRKASKYSLRTATQRFLKDVQKTGAAGVDKIVAKYVTEKAAFRANLIARHETVEAFRRSYIEQSKNKPGVIGMQWRLSPTRHPVPDECDVYANQNAYKLGPGIYPVDKVPRHPHPACICSVTVVLDKHHFQREAGAKNVPPLPRDDKSPDALGWLKNNDALASKILGPTRHKMLHAGVNVLDAEGKPRLVRDLLGKERQKLVVGLKPSPDLAQAHAKQEAERAAAKQRAAKQEAERVAKQEAERVAKQEAERVARLEAERAAKAAKLEAERAAKLEAERAAKAAKKAPKDALRILPSIEGDISEARKRARKVMDERGISLGKRHGDRSRHVVDQILEAEGLSSVQQRWSGEAVGSGWHITSTDANGALGHWLVREPRKAEVVALAKELSYRGDNPGDVVAFARTQYAATQEVLQKRIADGTLPNVDKRGYVTLYRGVKSDQGIALRKAFADGDDAELRVRSLSSWSTDIKAARNFASVDGAVVKKKVHVSRVFSQWEHSNFSSRTYGDEAEWIVITPEEKMAVERAEVVD